MVELVLFICGMIMAWALAILVGAERQRRVRAIQQAIIAERAAAAEAAAKHKPHHDAPTPDSQPPIVAKAA
jgi:hypothetical protein